MRRARMEVEIYPRRELEYMHLDKLFFTLSVRAFCPFNEVITAFHTSLLLIHVMNADMRS
jgi:hypothetical protein